MITQYIIRVESDKANFSLKVKYKSGRFKSLEHVSGKFANQEQFEYIIKLTPQLEAAILLLEKEYSGKVTWEKVQQAEQVESWYRSLLAAYMEWHQNRTGLPYKMTGGDGNAMKKITSYLQAIYTTLPEALDKWNNLLQQWDQLPEFYRNKSELRNIDSNLNFIMQRLTGKSSSELNDVFSNLINGKKG